MSCPSTGQGAASVYVNNMYLGGSNSAYRVCALIKGLGNNVGLTIGNGVQTFAGKRLNFNNSSYTNYCTDTFHVTKSTALTAQVDLQPYKGGGWFNVMNITLQQL